MKISLTNDICRAGISGGIGLASVKRCRPETAIGIVSKGARGSAHWAAGPSRGFTMMEIAISLAVIGIALVAIIGVLPIGMSTQQDNRQETIIGQDASVLMEAVRNGSLGMDDLTNYVFAITNYWAEFKNGVIVSPAGVYNSYNHSTAIVNSGYLNPAIVNTALEWPLTNGANIIGLLSTPEFTDPSGNPINNIFLPDFYSNHIVACVYSLSGPVIEKPPQDNPILQQDSFTYRIYCVNSPVAVDTNIFNTTVYPNGPPVGVQQMNAAQHELRMTFMWPQLANGNLGSGRQTFRTLIAGQLLRQPSVSPANPNISWNPYFYCYQPQFFTNTP